MATTKPNLLVIAGADSPELKVLDSAKGEVNIVATGRNLEELSHLTTEDWSSIDVVLNCGVGALQGKREDLQAMWPRLTGLKWVHSASAGIEKLVFPELVESDVPVTNARGVYSHSLAEYALTCCNWFAKDLPRMRAAQQARRWEHYEVEELRGKTFGVIGYGDIGQSCARLAKAFRMRVIALRRSGAMTDADKQDGILSAVFGSDSLLDLVRECDYILMATPATPETHQLFSADCVAAMKANAVFVNVGRGTCVDEPALIKALESGSIRGAGLDVFYQEPLPKESALYGLDNVLMSAHCADKTADFQYQTLEFFVENLRTYAAGQPLKNVVDKKQGY